MIFKICPEKGCDEFLQKRSGCFWVLNILAQVSISNDGSLPDPSAMLEIKSAGKGLLPPRDALKATNNAGIPYGSPAVITTLCNNYFTVSVSFGGMVRDACPGIFPETTGHNDVYHYKN